MNDGTAGALAAENLLLRSLVDKLLFSSGYDIETDLPGDNAALHMPARPKWGCTLTGDQARLIAEIRGT